MRALRLTAVLVAALAALGLGACGSDDESSNANEGGPLDAAFMKSMIPHHESAVAMAKLAQERGRHPKITELADAIVGAQESEIAKMEDIYERLYGEEIVPDPEASTELGLGMDEAGMHEGGMAALESATRDFDKVFIDQMVPHHQGAIRQARALLEETSDDELRSLGRAIVEAQSAEIRQMNGWRKRWYGAASPAGGVPVDDESADDGAPHESH